MRIQVPVSWLRELVEFDVSVDQLAELLHMSGTEVDHVERRGGWEHVFVARVSALERHPNADKLQLATVEYGQGRSKTVVTGATNLHVGAVVPYAETGAKLRSGEGDGEITLEPRKMRGIVSEGMVCSARELGLGDDHEGILILDDALPVGAPLADVLGETILHLELQPNRPDCLGVAGIAREVAALTGAELREPATEPLAYGRVPPAQLRVRVEDPAGCPRFAAAYLEDVRVGPSPRWMQERLIAAGMRPIENVVDITNYVMLELGQPLHAYDATRLAGRTLVARRAAQNEHLRTLDGIDRVLPAGTLVIADEERALGLAGILGGEDSEIRDDTTSIALECASFEPRGIGATSTALGLHGSSGSAAARRFSWELSQDLVPIALARASRLLVEHAGARVIGAVDVYPRPRARANVRMRFSEFARVLGIEIGRDEAVGALRRLGFAYADDGDTLVVTPPAVRTDIKIPEDVIEEVARIVGYERLPTRVPAGPLPLREPHPLEDLRERVRDRLAGLGLHEIVSYSLVDPAWLARVGIPAEDAAPPLRVANPTTVTQSALRTTLRAGLFDAAQRNLRHRDGVALFEIAPIYVQRAGDLPEERWTVATLLSGSADPGSWLGAQREFDLWDAKAVVTAVLASERASEALASSGSRSAGAAGLHPGRSERWTVSGADVVAWGAVDPRVAGDWDLPQATFIAEIDLTGLLRLAQPPQAKAPPRYPAAVREVAFVVAEDVAYGDLERELRAAARGVLESVELLDVYRGPQAGEGRKSLAVRVVLRSGSGTLADAEIDRAMKRVEGRLQHTLGATVRA